MQCPKCATDLNLNDETCSNCHEKINQDEKTTLHPQVPLKRPMPRWFKFAVGLTLIALCIVSGGLLFTESLVDVPQKQLHALQNNEIESAYLDYTSTQFKANTSLEQFRHFIETYPILMTHYSASFPQRSIVDHMTILKGKLLAGDQSSTPIEYRLIKEEGKWKILSLSLLKGQSQNKAEKRKIIQITKSLLKDIRGGEIESGYEMYFSNNFKASTSLENLKNLIQQNPLLMQDYQVSFHNPIIKDDAGSLSIVLKAGQDRIYLNNHYIQDKNGWKISSLRILSPSLAEKQAS